MARNGGFSGQQRIPGKEWRKLTPSERVTYLSKRQKLRRRLAKDLDTQRARAYLKWLETGFPTIKAVQYFLANQDWLVEK